MKPTFTSIFSGLSEPAANTPPEMRPVSEAVAPAANRRRRVGLVASVMLKSFFATVE
jgi:hypothetical protein